MTIKTEMHGTGGGRWTTRADAKETADSARRQVDKDAVSEELADTEPRGNKWCSCRRPGSLTLCIAVRSQAGLYWMCPWCEIPEGCVFLVEPDAE